jgi:hypothetical protein
LVIERPLDDTVPTSLEELNANIEALGLPPVVERSWTPGAGSSSGGDPDPSGASPGSDVTRVMQYNILAEGLSSLPTATPPNPSNVDVSPSDGGGFSNPSTRGLDFSFRKYRLLTEILHYKPHILTLQENDANNFLTACLSHHNYASVHQSKPDSPCLEFGYYSDGVSVYFDESRYDLVGDYSSSFIGDVKVPHVIVQLKDKHATGSHSDELYVVSTHLKAKSGNEHIRLRQMAALISKLKALPDISKTTIIFNGDFNCDVGGEADDSGALTSVINDLADNADFLTSAYDLRSAVSEDNAGGLFSTAKARKGVVCKRMIDYLYHSKNVATLRTLGAPSMDEITAELLPNESFPSDHLSMVVDYVPVPKSNTVAVATLNVLGDSYNPFEFLNDDSAFLGDYNALADSADTITWDDVVAVAGSEVIEACPEAMKELEDYCKVEGNGVYRFFNEDKLKNDNKLTNGRINLITQAMIGYNNEPLWWAVETWQKNIVSQIQTDNCDYASDYTLYVWDVICNVIVTKRKDNYLNICKRSYINPSNFTSHANTFIQALMDSADGKPIVCGCQEWPKADSLKGKAFNECYAKAGFKIVTTADENGCALVYSRVIKTTIAPEVLTVDFKAIMEKCIQDTEGIDDKQKKGFISTTARKSMVVKMFNEDDKTCTIFVVIHSKEPKNDNAGICLAKYIKAIGDSVKQTGDNVITMIDTNIANVKLSKAFHTFLETDNAFNVAPNYDEITTAKQRSILHGQRYDEKKCLKVVKACKDKIICESLDTTCTSIHPNLDVTQGLPGSYWASDHCLVTSGCVVALKIEERGSFGP